MGWIFGQFAKEHEVGKFLVISVSFLTVLLSVQTGFGQSKRMLGLNRSSPQGAASAVGANVRSLFDDPKWKQIRANQVEQLYRSSPRTSSQQERIFHGLPATEGALNGTVAVFLDGGGLCTGSLVAPQVVVCAAHCLVEENGESVQAKNVYVGLNVNEVDTRNQYNVRAQFAHPNYNAANNQNDISVLILDQPISSSVATPYRIADEQLIGSHDVVTLAGFGYTHLGEIGKKFFVEVPYVTNGCGSFGCIEGSEFVAGNKERARDSCNGDSGGPAFIKSGSNLVLAGVTSRAIAGATVDPATGKVCGDGGVYVRADKYFGFISQSAESAGVTAPTQIGTAPPEQPVDNTEAKARKELIMSLEALLKILKAKD